MESESNEEHIVKILWTEYVTHNVKRFRFEKPQGFVYKPGQATDVSINKPVWKMMKNPFTFTSLNEWDELEFTIKIYPERKGVTAELDMLNRGDELIIREPFGTINYSGPGVFIAGGAGVTPFIAIFRQLEKDNQINGSKLIFSNKTKEDIILKDEFERILGKNFYNFLSREPGSERRRIDINYLKSIISDFNRHFYVCGPDVFVKNIKEMLGMMGISPETVVFEK